MARASVRVLSLCAMAATWVGCSSEGALGAFPDASDDAQRAWPTPGSLDAAGAVVDGGGAAADARADGAAAADAARPPDAAGGGADPYAAQRDAVVAEINKLRATKGLPPYTRWLAGEPCADKQAEDDSKTGIAHNAWRTGKFGCPGGKNENECPGWGGPACVDSMWAESKAAACANCDSCAGDHGCTGCDFYGTITGTVCGHYENLSAKSFTQVAVGFGGGWMLINFN